MLSAVIHEAIEDYRLGRDMAPTQFGGRIAGTPDPRGFDGKRYAAARVDVVAHSRGGQITRLYMSDIDTISMPMGYSRDGAAVTPPPVPPPGPGVWQSFYIARSEGFEIGRAKRYLRPDNYLGGDIRRFLPLGSPFRGSELANDLEPWVRPTATNIALMGAARPLLSSGLRTSLFGSPNGSTYIPPSCCADLQVGSAAQGLLEAANYASDMTISWIPMVGIAPEDVADETVQSVLWELLFRLPNLDDEDSWSFSISPRNPTNGDLIVGQWSQRNASGPNDTRAGTGYAFTYTAHVPVAGVLDGETASVKIGTDGQSTPNALSVSNLLSGTKSQMNGGGLGQ
jgi:hypothetical protein